MTILKIKKISPNAIVPSYAHPGDAGMDLYSCEDVTISPSERKLIPTGISVIIPEGCVGLIWDKSGLAVKHGLTTLAGVIDEGYRGEIKVAIFNTSKEVYTFEKGHKVAQMLIQKVESPEIIEVEELDDTSRGSGGFGSTGL